MSPAINAATPAARGRALSRLSPVSARSFVVFMGVIALIGLLAFGLLSKGEARLQVGEQFPSNSLERLGSSETGSIADYRDRWVLVNLWASWCGPCKDEAPEIEAFYRRHRGDGFVVLGVDTQEDRRERARVRCDPTMIDEKLASPTRSCHDGIG